MKRLPSEQDVEKRVQEARNDEIAHIKNVFGVDSEPVLFLVFLLELVSGRDIKSLKPNVAMRGLLDSLGAVELILMLEKRYNIEISDEKAIEMNVITDAVEYVKDFTKYESRSYEEAYYSAANEMMIHYSNCRLGIMTIILPACLAVLGIIISLNLPLLTKIILFICEVVLFYYCFALAVFFSRKQEQVRRYLCKFESGETEPFHIKAISLKAQKIPLFDGINMGIMISSVVIHAVFVVIVFV